MLHDSRYRPRRHRLPIKLDSTSNGEFVPVPLSRANRHANHLAHERATASAKRLGLARRDFLVSACGAASALLAFNTANANVYAELGSTWRFLMRDPEAAAHALGKLLKYAGEDNVLWGTDSIWYGSPQDQIQAFRTFQISAGLRAKIFGLNAAKVYSLSADEVKKYTQRDRIARERLAYLEHPDPHYLTYGPKTRRQFLNLLGSSGGTPG